MGAVMSPIPLSLLPDSMEVQAPADSGYGGEYAAPVTVEHVRFENSMEMVRRGYVLNDGSRGLVYIDAANSAGATDGEGCFTVPVGSLVRIGNKDLSVVKVVPCPGFFGVVHHWEIEVR